MSKVIIWESPHPLTKKPMVNVMRPHPIADMPHAHEVALARCLQTLPPEAADHFVIDESELPEYSVETRDQWFIKDGKVCAPD